MYIVLNCIQCEFIGYENFMIFDISKTRRMDFFNIVMEKNFVEWKPFVCLE